MTEQEKDALRQILAEHAHRYPLMEPMDAVKLIFQNEFGGGHLISDPNASLQFLKDEAAAVQYDPSMPLIEDIGNGMARIMLSALGGTDGYSVDMPNRDFVRSAEHHKGSAVAFQQKLDVLRGLAESGIFHFSYDELNDYLKKYMATGCRPVSHSETYRQTYRPAYRVVEKRTSFPGFLQDVHHRLDGASRLIIAIDGRCASGKTTLAGKLCRRYGYSVIHMDHFFLRPEQRTAERYAMPGGNIDHERFLDEVLIPLRAGKSVSYCPFDCGTGALAPPVHVEPTAVTIVEGSYSCHPSLWEYYDLRMFLTVEHSEQIRRIEARNGKVYAKDFRDKWIPMEERYFEAYSLADHCEYSIEI